MNKGGNGQCCRQITMLRKIWEKVLVMWDVIGCSKVKYQMGWLRSRWTKNRITIVLSKGCGVTHVLKPVCVCEIKRESSLCLFMYFKLGTQLNSHSHSPLFLSLPSFLPHHSLSFSSSTNQHIHFLFLPCTTITFSSHPPSSPPNSNPFPLCNSVLSGCFSISTACPSFPFKSFLSFPKIHFLGFLQIHS